MSDNLHSCRVIPLHLPSFGTHVSRTKDVDCAISFTHDHAMIYLTLCNAGIDRHVQRAQRVAVVLVKVSALSRLAYAIEAVDLQVRGERKSCLEWVDPFSRKKLVIFDLVLGASDALRIAALQHIFVPAFRLAPEKWKSFIYS